MIDNQNQENRDSLKDNCIKLYWKMILKGVDYSVKEEREKTSYLHSKVREIDTSYPFLLGEHSKEYMMSYLLIEDIKNSIPDLNSISDILGIKYLIDKKNNEVKGKLCSRKNQVEMVQIMKEYYDFLLEILSVKVSSVLSYKKEGVVL